jgi:hypothetical protein
MGILLVAFGFRRCRLFFIRRMVTKTTATAPTPIPPIERANVNLSLFSGNDVVVVSAL